MAVADLGRLCYREDLGLIVEADDGRVLAEVACTDGAHFTMFPGGWQSGMDLYGITWMQYPKEPRGYIDVDSIEVDPPPPPRPQLGAGDV
jgi:hypothetical protein